MSDDTQKLARLASLDAALPTRLREWLAEDPTRFVDNTGEGGLSCQERLANLKTLGEVLAGGPVKEPRCLADVLSGYGSDDVLWTSDIFWMLGHLERTSATGAAPHLSFEAASEAGEFDGTYEEFEAMMRATMRFAAAVQAEVPLPPSIDFERFAKWWRSPAAKSWRTSKKRN